MNCFGKLSKLLYGKPWSILVRAPLFALLAALFWKFQSKAICEVAIFAVFIYALAAERKRIHVWVNSLGVPFIILLVFTVITVPLSTSPMLSARDLVKALPTLALAFAIPLVFHNRSRLEAVLFYSAVGLTAVLGYDLVRLLVKLGSGVIAKAHSFEPFILNHSNVASMAAGAAFFVLAYFAWQWRTDRLRLGLCLLGMAVDLAYQVVIASRGPQVAFIGAVGTAGILLLPGWRKKVLWVMVPVLAGGLLLIVNPRFGDKASMRGLCDRDKVWAHTWELTKERPVLGYGFGKKVFEEVYHSSNPPASPFQFHHTHEYWLFALFQHGWTGLILYAAAWALLMLRLLCHLRRQIMFEARLLPGLIAVLLVFIHLYGLADWPDNIVQLMLIWLIPVALVVTGREDVLTGSQDEERNTTIVNA